MAIHICKNICHQTKAEKPKKTQNNNSNKERQTGLPDNCARQEEIFPSHLLLGLLSPSPGSKAGPQVSSPPAILTIISPLSLSLFQLHHPGLGCRPGQDCPPDGGGEAGPDRGGERPGDDDPRRDGLGGEGGRHQHSRGCGQAESRVLRGNSRSGAGDQGQDCCRQNMGGSQRTGWLQLDS